MTRLWHAWRMPLSTTLITILSGVCLLLWGLRLVKRAVLRGFGTQVQSGIALGTRNRLWALMSGMVITLFLQSSTATALLASSFVGRSLMSVTAGLAIMIGADIGSAVVAQILSFKITWLAPLLLSAGIITHLIYDNTSGKRRHVARIIIGIGFMLMALSIIREAAAPMAASDTLPLILRPLESEPILAVLIAAIITYMMHSSVSAILLFATLTGSGALPLDLGLMFMVGANFGIGLVPLFAVMRDTPKAVQIPLGNIIMRLVMGIAFLSFIPFIMREMALFDISDTQKIIYAHIAFNLAIAVMFMPFVEHLGKLCAKLSPVRESERDMERKPRYLDNKALSTPSVALSCATRETLHMAEIVEEMLKDSYEAIADHDEDTILRIKNKDDVLDVLFAAVKNYIIALSREELGDKETEQSMNIMTFATNLEHCGDIIDKSLMDIAGQKAKTQDSFSEEGLAEIKSFHEKVVKNLKLAQSIFISQDPILAKQLLEYKVGLKIAETQSAKSHMARLRSGLPATIATSAMHMDVIRDLRRINTYVSSVAYSILDAAERTK